MSMRVGLLLLLFASALQAQEADSAHWSARRIAKWTVLAASAGAVFYGFAENRSADNDYQDIERICQKTPSACAKKPGSQEYADPALETRYQDIVRRDQRARFALIAGQVGVAASVVLFILDLPKSAATDDIPYVPRPLRIGVDGAGNVRVSYKFPFK